MVEIVIISYNIAGLLVGAYMFQKINYFQYFSYPLFFFS